MTRLLSLPGAIDDRPFGPEPLVAKVGGKMFALLSAGLPHASVSLKIDPVEGEALRETWPAIIPGYHLNKRHWITVALDGTIPDELVDDLIRDSYDLVINGLSRAARDALVR